jgi:hypothetical protein
LSLWDDGDGLCATKGLLKKWFDDGCHCGSGAEAVAVPGHMGLPMGGGRGVPKLGGGRGGTGDPVAPQGARRPGAESALRGELNPHPGSDPCGTDRRPEAGSETNSSSSAARADEPRTPFGLGERRTGEPCADADADVESPDVPGGRAIGAIGAMSVMGVGRPIGPTSLTE